MKVITVSQKFPSYHPKAGEHTYFVEKIYQSLKGESIPNLPDGWEFSSEANKEMYGKLSQEVFAPKHHTIRAGNRWKAGDMASLRVWGNDINPKSGRKGPYHSKQITIAEVEIKKVWSFEKHLTSSNFFIDGKEITPDDVWQIAQNDGLSLSELLSWFKYPKPFTGQIICWNEKVEY